MREICQRLHLAPLTVYARFENDTIPSLHPGRNWIISRRAYEQWERTFGTNEPKRT